MAYLAESDIEAELSLDIDANSTPNTTEVAGFIADIEADLNGVLYAVGVSLPLTEASHPNAWKILTQTALWGVCSRVIAAFGGVVIEQGPKEANYWERYREKLRQIEENPASLYDAPFSTSSSRLSLGGLTSTDDDSYDPFFKMDDVF